MDPKQPSATGEPANGPTSPRLPSDRSPAVARRPPANAPGDPPPSGEQSDAGGPPPGKGSGAV